LRLGLPEQPASALIMVALARGLFSAQGLELVVARYPSGKLAFRDGLMTGAVDLVTAADAVMAKAGLQQAPVKAVASVFYADNINRVVARRSAGIGSPEELAGRPIGTQQASAVHFFWHLFSLEHNVHDPSLLRFMPAEVLPQALARGEIDAFSMREPYVTIAKDLLGDDALVLSAPGLYPQLEVLITRETLPKERALAVRLFLSALLEAQQFCEEEPEAAIALVAEQLGVPIDRISTFWPDIQLRVRLDQSLLLLLESQARWYIAAGLAPEQPIPNYLTLIDSTPLRALSPTSVTLID